MKKDEIDLPQLEKGTYLHHKSGKFYEVLGVALQTETNEALVLYRPLYNHPKYELFARPYNKFIEQVAVDDRLVPRFEKVD